MNLKSIVSARIHPAIGMARVGNSKEAGEEGYFIGPEFLPPVSRKPGFYRDRYGKLKRQAARFRVYGYDKDNRVVGELTASKSVKIEWTVHVANKKAAWYDFDIALDLPEAAGVRSARRNAQIQGTDRQKLIIAPPACTISGRNKRSIPLAGKFFDEDVDLGELRTDSQARLLFLGGFGKSGTPFAHCYPPFTFANNPGWHDDICDGPVSARIWIDGGELKNVESAWVVTAPPNYAPELVANQTMYDVIVDALGGRILPKPSHPPSFTDDILPVFRHFQDAQWLSAGFFKQFGWGGLTDFSRPDFLEALAQAPGSEDPFKELRMLVFNNFRDPNATDFEALKWPPVFGDSFGNPSSPPSPREAFAITNTSFQALQQWVNGNFIADFDPKRRPPRRLDDIQLSNQPGMLDRAALTFCMGGPFHPSLEMTWPMRHFWMYKGPFRLRRRPDDSPEPDFGEFLTPESALSRDGLISSSGPGDITKWMAVPWQTDMASCQAGYQGKDFPVDDFLPAFWLSRVPSNVLTEDNFREIASRKQSMKKRRAAFQERADWMRSLKPHDPSLELLSRAVREFGQLGVIERRTLPTPIPGLPSVMYVENLPPNAPKSSGRKHFKFDQELRAARFQHLPRHALPKR